MKQKIADMINSLMNSFFYLETNDIPSEFDWQYEPVTKNLFFYDGDDIYIVNASHEDNGCQGAVFPLYIGGTITVDKVRRIDSILRSKLYGEVLLYEKTFRMKFLKEPEKTEY